MKLRQKILYYKFNDRWDTLLYQLFLGVVDAYVKENTTELVDPLDVKKKVELLEEKRNILLTELDTQIKVSNATTFIEIE